MKNIYNLLTVALSLAATTVAYAQDPHLSQYFNAPQHLNPALTGGSDYDIRVSGHYRTQWGAFTTPFNTSAVDAQYAIHSGISDDDQMGVGLFLQNDVAGDGNLRRTQAQLSYGYFKSLGPEGTTFLSAGIQGGIIQHSLDFNKLYFDDQYDGDAVTGQQTETIDRQSMIVPDVSAGLGLQVAVSEQANIYAGGAVFHLNQANVGFYNNTKELLYQKIHGYIGMDYMFTEAITVSPRLVYMQQGQHRELNAGIMAKANFGSNMINDDPNAVYGGVYYRIDNNDAIIPMIRFDYGPIGISLNYDINMSKLTRVSNSYGAPELAIIYKTNIDGKGTLRNSRNKGLPCPKF